LIYFLLFFIQSVAELAAQRGLPSIGSVSGSSAIREPYNRLYVNIRYGQSGVLDPFDNDRP